MKQRYIKQVSKKLTVPAARKKEIIRDLEEVFASALENNETEQQIIGRLGSPEEFATSMNEYEVHGVRKSGVTGLVISAAIAVISFILYIVAISQQPPKYAIGQADAMTNIQLVSEFSPDVTNIILMVGVISLIVAVLCGALIVKKWRKK